MMLTPPELVVVVGPPQAGKSQWTDCYVANLARVHGIKTAILQFEDSIERVRGDSTYTYQLRAFLKAVRDGKPMPTDAVDAIANMRVIDAVYEKSGLRPRGLE